MDLNRIKFLIKNKQKEVAFYEEEHIYYFKGEKLPSVSSYIEMYSNPFDPDGIIIERTAAKKGISVEELREEWDENSNLAREFGTLVHAKYELMLHGIIEPNELIKKLLEDYELIDTEVILFDEKFAGQCDVLMYDKKKKGIILLDFKTNKKPITKENPYNKFMLGPYLDLPDTPYGHYTVQLNMYRTLLEKWGLKIKDMNLIQVSSEGYNFIPIQKITIKEVEK